MQELNEYPNPSSNEFHWISSTPVKHHVIQVPSLTTPVLLGRIPDCRRKMSPRHTGTFRAIVLTPSFFYLPTRQLTRPALHLTAGHVTCPVTLHVGPTEQTFIVRLQLLPSSE